MVKDLRPTVFPLLNVFDLVEIILIVLPIAIITVAVLLFSVGQVCVRLSILCSFPLLVHTQASEC